MIEIFRQNKKKVHSNGYEITIQILSNNTQLI